MRHSKIALALVVAFTGGAVLTAGLARAEDPAKEQMPPLQKEIKHPFLDSLVGSWNVETTGGMSGKGTATFAKGVGGTAILENYDSKSDQMAFFGHGVYKIADDQKTVTVWWFDNFGAEALKLTGPIKDTGYDISGECPGMGTMRITFEKKGEGMLFKMFMGEKESMTGNYTKAK